MSGPDSYVERLARLAYWMILIAGVVSLASLVWTGATGTIIGGDSTDAPSERSGLGLYVDHGTGCQYLVRQFSGVTPRLTVDGKPMCGGAK